MADNSTPVSDASSHSQQPAAESPEVLAARAKANEAGYARNRAEANYNSVKKEKGENSSEAKAAKEVLEKAQAEVEKAQSDLRSVLKLAAKSAAPAEVPAKSKQPAPPPAQKPQGQAAFIVEHEYIEVRPQYHEFIRVLPNDKNLHRRLEELLKRIQKNPKSLEHYRKQLNRGEQTQPLKIPQGEVLRLMQEAEKS